MFILTVVPLGKGVTYYAYDAGKVIGASKGEKTQYIRVEVKQTIC